MSDKPYFIDGQKYMVKSLTMKASELLFWRDNPRIFEKIRRLKGEDFNQEDIYTFFNEQPTTRDLVAFFVSIFGSLKCFRENLKNIPNSSLM